MPLCTEFDVFEAVKVRWAAVPAAPAAAPGGLWPQRKPQGKLWPYVVCRVEPDRFEGDSSRVWLQTFGVELTAWDKTTAADARTLRALLDAVMAEGGLSVPNAARTLRVWPRPGKLDLAPDLLSGADVLAVAGRWWVKVAAVRD